MNKNYELIKKIIEDGKYDELIAAKGYFAELVDRQRLDTD